MKKIILILLFLFTLVFIKANTVSAFTCGGVERGTCPAGTIQFCSDAATGYLFGCCPSGTSVLYCGGQAYCYSGAVYCNNGSIDTGPCAEYGNTYPQYCSSINWCIPSTSSCSDYTVCGGRAYSCPTGYEINCGPPVTCQIPSYTISGNVFLDINQNGVMDTSEACYASSGTTLTVFPQGGGGIDYYPLTTGCSYSLPKQYNSSYTVALYSSSTPSGYASTTNNQNISSTNSTGVNFGLAQGMPAALSGEALDQSQSGRSSSNQYPSLYAQTFVPAVSGQLNKVVFSLVNPFAQNDSVYIKVAIVTTDGSGFPTSTTVGSEEILDKTALITPGRVKTVTFTTKPQLTAGTKYAIRFTANAITPNPELERNDSAYANGSSYRYDNFLNKWFLIGWDLFFGTYMTNVTSSTPSPSPSPLPISPSPSPSPPPTGLTTSISCGTGVARATELVSTPQFQSGSKFGTSGACIIDPKATFVPFKIPTYEDLKSIYFDQLKSSAKSTISPGANPANQGNLNSAVSSSDTQKSIFVNGDLQINGNLTFNNASIPIVVFVKDNLTISSDINYGKNSSSAGLVFVVGKEIAINTDVSEINAILISQGTIYTAGSNCNTNSVSANQLVINGSLISLKQPPITDPNAVYIKFCRILPGNQNATLAAEKINHQVKYLVLLRHLLSDTLQKWSEITDPHPLPQPTSAQTQLSSLYVDNDGDGYGIGIPITTCPAGKKCVTNNQDCWDANANAKPGQTACFRTHRGDSSFDYDCDGKVTIAKDSACTTVANKCADYTFPGETKPVTNYAESGFRDNICYGASYGFCYAGITPLSASDCGTTPWATDNITRTYNAGSCAPYGTKYDAYQYEIHCR